MSETAEMKTCELEGAALDWAVAVIEGYDLMKHPFRRAYIQNFGYCDYSPSINWTFGGPLIEKYRFEFEWVGNDWHGEPLNFFTACGFDMPADAASAGPTHLIAACRAIVRAKLGETINVPAELIK
ncbi:phage protein NinX family protein [Pseudomonas aeruginosa]|uniref:phage protein NinX family protein n=1 Tax=Pseudomonas aeruginosa TaxID=287 RepID=UPI0028878EB4|nr:phage protein NinX family protein [Pseudomonas aeruginosa]MDT0990785.1 phage protein NinX family protein [Pseudomonas aeruginosa]